ncbi:MAG TPA: AGE family epimerase/isomerase [Acidobacteriota bacterium]|nr:AGE family epimerase/isomerase [Acidobacteriota bacterium]
MIPRSLIQSFRDRVERELTHDILPFWTKYSIDNERGGFWGTIENDLVIHKESEKGIILNARILWAFSRLFRACHDPTQLELAQRALDYLTRHFIDSEYGEAYWTLDCSGRPLDSKKKIYAQAFALYALVEYYEATGDRVALGKASDIFNLIELKSRDAGSDGYFETYERDWSPARDQRLSEVDMDEKKSMNTHLHVLEAYSSLARTNTEALSTLRLRELIEIFLKHIIDPESHHFRLFFTESWTCRSNRISFGHDIEGSWLLCEAADALKDPTLQKKVQGTAVRMAHAVYREARDSDGAILYEADPTGITDYSKQWWPQAEAVVGFLNAYEISGEERFFHAAHEAWEFIERRLIDKVHGEWFWQVSREGKPDPGRYKVGQWKGPYHNSRACLETMLRLDKVLSRVHVSVPVSA